MQMCKEIVIFTLYRETSWLGSYILAETLTFTNYLVFGILIKFFDIVSLLYYVISISKLYQDFSSLLKCPAMTANHGPLC